LEEENRQFKFTHCVDILHQLPKFAPMNSHDSSDEAETLPKDKDQKNNYNKVGSVMGDDMVRPMGCKKAKKLRRENASDTTSIMSDSSIPSTNLTAIQSHLSVISTTISERAKSDVAIQERKQLFQERKHLLQERKHLLSMARYYSGQVDRLKSNLMLLTD